MEYRIEQYQKILNFEQTLFGINEGEIRTGYTFDIWKDKWVIKLWRLNNMFNRNSGDNSL